VISQHREAISPDTIRHAIDRVGDHDLTDPSSSREREETQRQLGRTRLSPWSNHTGSVTGIHRMDVQSDGTNRCTARERRGTSRAPKRITSIAIMDLSSAFVIELPDDGSEG
jgi:hypothetical protein